MTNEQILEELREAMKANNEANVKSNEAICYAINAVEEADKEYERGMNDAWEIAREIYTYNYHDLERIFREEESLIICSIIKKYTPMEVKEKLNTYKKLKQSPIEAGDIVKDIGDATRAIILNKNSGGMWEVFSENGYIDRWYEGYFVKTGEHADLFEVLKLERE